MVEKCYGDTDLPRLSGAGAWCGSAAELSRLIASIDGLPHVKDILSQKSIQFMTTEQPDHQYSIGWNYTPKSNRPWIRTGSLAGTSAIVLKYPDVSAGFSSPTPPPGRVTASATTPWHSLRSSASSSWQICRRRICSYREGRKKSGKVWRLQKNSVYLQADLRLKTRL